MMKLLVASKRSAIVIFFIVSCVFILIQCINNGNDGNEKKEKEASVPDIRKVNFQQFAGSATCGNCHKKIYESHSHTSHYLTSQPAIEKYIKGSFEKGKNIFPYNPSLFVEMERRDSGLYQVAYNNGVEKIARRFDIVVGSGAKGQTYLSWRNNHLFQLPISYFTAAGEWANSPGYPNRVLFNRPVTSRCLECHSTYASTISPPNKEPEEFDHYKILFGVDCEKCHGPASKHVNYQTQNPTDTTAKYIVNPARLSRQQNLDLCGLCHGGRLQKKKPSFEFTAGDTLSDYFVHDTSSPDTRSIDVHGNQLGLLSESKCFRQSGLTCVTCHNPHENERGKVALFSARCMTCHNKEHGTFCKINPAQVSSIRSNCIDCHMPRQPSMSIALLLPGQQVPTAALIHTHFIKVYPDETKKFITDQNKKRVHQ
jgi:nitrate/TMAO reductase-like tetraheme cytochrome c subunit